MVRIFAIIAALIVSAPLAAQDIAGDTAVAQPTLAQPASLMDQARDAQEIARLMGEVQTAVSLAQTQYVGMVTGGPGAGYQGAIALPTDEPGVWRAVIVGRQDIDKPDADWLELAEYEIANGAIRSETIHPQSNIPLLTGTASAMAQARSFAPRVVLAAGNNAFCLDESAGASVTASVTFATIVLPPRDNGTFDAYVLNGPIEEGAIPLGRHYRVGFDKFGLQGTPDLITDTCEVITWSANDADLATKVYLTNYEGAETPSPVHILLSTLLPMRLGVTTGDTMWPVVSGTVGEPMPADQVQVAP
ncbi:hypothetical protein CP97_11840 [Aurantiacibacter atlanticus]|uniref:Uncharacterized protein n=1 Tax=Aurantiacibacter atlanticus TaxID=1648404 RepID=A0A0H4VI03_9SPHN|nr:hypothetical protein [Aurantiacibacter atlanticus]AKQ42579.1 hypothetical protein CP97_11840 [Aurantiacibacter atlanticus]